MAALVSSLVGVGCLLASTVGGAATVPPETAQQLQADRGHIALDLSEPIAICVAKHDTANPAFHGCIDWHSAVHGTWALTAYMWATGDQRYRALVDSILQPGLLAQERKRLANDPGFEMPYGRSWFLRLAIDYQRAYGNGLLDGFGDEVADSLVAYYTKIAPDPASIAYRSATWALINLYDYGLSRHDNRLVEFVRDKVQAYYLKDGPCPLKSAEIDAGEFMAVCTNWAWLVQRVLPREKFIAWLAVSMPPSLPLEPIVHPAAVHQAGLNFSRCWGLWGLYQATGDERFLKLYLRHFHQTYSDTALWKGDYRTVSHWVAQFGMLDLILTYYDLP